MPRNSTGIDERKSRESKRKERQGSDHRVDLGWFRGATKSVWFIKREGGVTKERRGLETMENQYRVHIKVPLEKREKLTRTEKKKVVRHEPELKGSISCFPLFIQFWCPSAVAASQAQPHKRPSTAALVGLALLSLFLTPASNMSC